MSNWWSRDPVADSGQDGWWENDPPSGELDDPDPLGAEASKKRRAAEVAERDARLDEPYRPNVTKAAMREARRNPPNPELAAKPTGSVMDGARAAQTAPGVTESLAPVRPEVRRSIEQAYDAGGQEMRGRLASEPGFVGQIARERGQRTAALESSGAAGRSVSPSREARAGRLIAGDRLNPAGMDPETARNMAGTAAALGVTPGMEVTGTAGQTNVDFDTERFFNRGAGSDPVSRGLTKGALGLASGSAGVGQYLADVVFGESPDGSTSSRAARWLESQERSIGESRGSFLERNVEGAIASLSQQLPARVAGAATGGAALTLSLIAVNSFGREYLAGRSAGLDLGSAAARASLFSAFEVVGESFGLGGLLKQLGKAASGMTNVGEIARFFASNLVKEIPGQLLTTTGQFAVDKARPFGLNQEAGMEQYLRQVADTIAQTVLQGGMTAAGTTGVSSAARFLRQGDTTSPEAQFARALEESTRGTWDRGAIDAEVRASMSPDPAAVDPATTSFAPRLASDTGQPVPVAPAGASQAGGASVIGSDLTRAAGLVDLVVPAPQVDPLLGKLDEAAALAGGAPTGVALPAAGGAPAVEDVDPGIMALAEQRAARTRDTMRREAEFEGATAQRATAPPDDSVSVEDQQTLADAQRILDAKGPENVGSAMGEALTQAAGRVRPAPAPDMLSRTVAESDVQRTDPNTGAPLGPFTSRDSAKLAINRRGLSGTHVVTSVDGGFVGREVRAADRTSTVSAALGARATPAAEWFGRRGDGYQTQAEAEAQIPARQRAEPGLDWRVESMSSGRFKLAGYSAGEANARTVPSTPGAAPQSGMARVSPVQLGTLAQDAPGADQLGAQDEARGAAGMAGEPERAAPSLAQARAHPNRTIQIVRTLNADRRVRAIGGLRAVTRGQDNMVRALAAAFGKRTVLVEPSRAGATLPFQGAILGDTIVLDARSDEAPIAVAAHEVFHGLDDDLKGRVIEVVRQHTKNLAKFAEDFQYSGDPVEKQREELAAFVVQDEAAKKPFWDEVRKALGDSDFARFAQAMLDALDRLIAGFQVGDRSPYVRKTKEVRRAIAQAFAEQLQRNGNMRAAEEAAGADMPLSAAEREAAQAELDEELGQQGEPGGDDAFAGQFANRPEWRADKKGRPLKSQSKPGISIEVAPNPDNKAMHDKWSAISGPERERLSILLGDKYIRKALDRMGARYTIEHTIGGFQGESNPSIIVRFTGKPEFDEVRSVALALGRLLDQQAVIAYDENITDGDGLTTFVKLIPDRELTQPEVAEVFSRIHQKFPQAAGFTLRDGGLVFGNFDKGVADDDFHDAIDAAASMALDDVGFESFRRSFLSDYVEVQNGEGDSARAEAGRDDLWRGERGLGALQASFREELAREVKAARAPGVRSSVALRDGTEDLSKYGIRRGSNAKTREIAAALEKRALKFGAIGEFDYSDRARNEIAEAFADEVEYQLVRDSSAQTGSGTGWYSVNFPAAELKLRKFFPELGHSKDARSLLTLLIAITSNGEKVPRNLAMAMELYEGYVHDNKPLTRIGTRTKQQDALDKNLAAVERLIEERGVAGAVEYLLEEMTVGEINAQLRAAGLDDVGDYPVDARLPRAAIVVGPKLGAFFANLMGREGYLTMDMWWTRSFNRVRGLLIPTPTDSLLDGMKQLLGDPTMSDDEAIMLAMPYEQEYRENNFKIPDDYAGNPEVVKRANTLIKAAFENLNEAPLRSNERAFMIRTAERTQQLLAKRGYTLSIADIQAALWYYEKRLYADLGARDSGDIGYEEAIDRIIEAGDRPARSAAPVDRFAAARNQAEPGRASFSNRAAGPAESAGGPGGGGTQGTGGGAPSAGGWSKRSPQAQAVTVDGWHFSNDRRPLLSGTYYGRGIKGEESKRLAESRDPRISRRVYFYIPRDDGTAPPREQGLGAFRHEARLSNLYDPTTGDPRVSRIADGMNAFESSVLDAGYDGYIARGLGMAVVLDADVPVRFVGTETRAAAAEPAPQARLKKALMGREIEPAERVAARFPGARVRNGSMEIDAGDRDAVNAAMAEEGLPVRFSNREIPPLRMERRGKTEWISDGGEFRLEDGGFGTWVAEADGDSFMGDSRAEAMEWLRGKHREAWLRKSGLDIASEVTPEQGVRMIEGLKKIHQLEGATRFATPPENVTDLLEIIDTMTGNDPAYSIETDGARTELFGNGKLLAYFGPKRKDKASMAWSDTDIYTDTSGFGSDGGGTMWYQALLLWAARNKRVVQPDYLLTPINAFRRTEQMLNAALRAGTTRYMRPHPDQRVYGWDPDPRTREDENRNVLRLALAAERNAVENIPELADLRYNVKSSVFTLNGEELGADAIRDILNSQLSRAAGVGRSTLARALVIRDLRSGAARPGGVEDAYRALLELPVPDAEAGSAGRVLEDGPEGSADGGARPVGRLMADLFYSNRGPDGALSTGGVWYSELARKIEAGPGQAMPDQWRAYIEGLKSKGVKPDEIEWSGVREWLATQTGKVKRDAVLEYLRAGGVRVEEVALGDTDRAADALTHEIVGRAKYSAYTLPGGTNYREVLLTLPEPDRLAAAKEAGYTARKTSYGWQIVNKDGDGVGSGRGETADAALSSWAEVAKNLAGGNPYRSAHWDQSNVLAHIRLNDRTDADGKRVLFVEEIQSDWGQEGKKKGFRKEGQSAWDKFAERGFYVEQDDDFWMVYDYNGDPVAEGETREEAIRDLVGRDQNDGEQMVPGGGSKDGGVPVAPFVTKTDAWVALALKRIVKMAVDEGYDRVAFVTGDQAADRFDLSKQIDTIAYAKSTSGDTVSIDAVKDGKNVFSRANVPMSEVGGLLGKEVAQKIANGEGEVNADGYSELSGLDLKVGGEGMRAFYDQIVPAVTKDVLKKLGGGRMATVQIMDAASKRTPLEAMQAARSASGMTMNQWMRMTSAEQFSLAQPYLDNQPTMRQPGFDITPAMREKVAGGVPMFSNRDKSGWRDELGRLQFRPGDAVYRRAAAAIDPLLDVLRLKPASPEMKRRLREMKIVVSRARDLTMDVAGEMFKLSEDERQMISDIIEGELAVGAVPPKHVADIATKIAAAMEAQTNELVRLGMLSNESADMWRGKYLPRFYESKLRTKVDPWVDAAKKLLGRTPTMQGIRGKHLRGRGMYETVPVQDLKQWEASGWQVRDPGFDPAQHDTVQVWRDFTRDEREQMGEIRDAAFRFVMGYNASQKDIALGRMFERIASDYGSRTPQAGYVRVPDTKVEGTGVTRYGKLAGMYVPREVLSQLSAFDDTGSADEIVKFYRKALSLWKEGKVVLNPVSHANNVISNVTMAHFAGVSYWHAHKYVGAIRDLVNGDPMVDEARREGLFIGTMTQAELLEIMPEQMRMLAAMQENRAEKAVQQVWSALSFWLRKPMGKAYEAEDLFFRYLIYRDARKSGLDPQDAIDYAQRFIFTYDDLPQGARVIRDTALPFFAYTYKAIPALASVALRHPMRFLAPAAALHLVNALMYAIAADEDDDDWMRSIKRYVTDEEFRKQAREKQAMERANMPPWLKGSSYVLGTPKAVRLGMDELTQLPVFLDVSRIFPGGDLLDVNSNTGGVPWLQPLTPSNPLFTAGMAFFGNRDMWFGKDIVSKADTDAEAAQKMGAWAWRQFAPAIAVNNYHWDRVMNTIAASTGKSIDWWPADYTGIGRDGLPSQPKYLGMNTFGIKARPYDLDRSEEIMKSRKESLIRELQTEIRRTQRLMNLGERGAMSEAQGEAHIELQRTKIQRLRDGFDVDGDEID